MFAHRSGKSEGTSVMPTPLPTPLPTPVPTPAGGSFKSEIADVVEKKRKQSVADKLYNNFKKREFRKGLSSRSDTSHLDTEDAAERKRQRDERKKEAHYERMLAAQRIEGYADLMAAKERFEFERQIVQKAEVRRFLCNIFLDIGVIMEEKRNEKGFFSAMTDYVTCSLGGGFTNTEKALKDNAKASSKAQRKSAKDPGSSSSSRRPSLAAPDGTDLGPKNDEPSQSSCVLA